MAQCRIILVIMGSRDVGKPLAEAARHVDADVLEFYPSQRRPLIPSVQRQREVALSEVERAFKSQIKDTGDGTSANVAAIVFIMHDTESSAGSPLPFTTETSFLGLSSRALFEKLFVLQPSPHVKQCWKDMEDAGMRVLSSKIQPDELLRQILANRKDDRKRVTVQKYRDLAQATSRHPDQVVILLVGHSGHGKSKTINRLIGNSLLEVGNKMGSTTKAIQRVKVPVFNSETGVTVNLAFDDTPGYFDAAYKDQAQNSGLMKLYQQRYFSENPDLPWQKYPNVILLVASWDSITLDAHNQPPHFTSPIGQSMYKLSLSGLVDSNRNNVIVVVTKCMSFLDDLADYKTRKEKNEQWNTNAGRRIDIIRDLQQKMFNGQPPWPIVFIENGGGQEIDQKYPTLPNGELSHQNLFEAIRGIIEGLQGPSDFAGLQAMQLIADVESLHRSFQPQKEILVDKSYEVSAIRDEAAQDINPNRTSHSESAIMQLANKYMGVTYDPVTGKYGRRCVLKLDPTDIIFERSSGYAQMRITEIGSLEEEQRTAAFRLHCQFEVASLASLGALAEHSNSNVFARTHDSHLYVHQHVTTEVAIGPLRPVLSDEMRKIISELPRWSEKTKADYDEFFVSYGTHVVLRMALGGNLRIVVNEAGNATGHKRRKRFQVEGSVPVPSGAPLSFGVSGGYSSDRAAHDTRTRRKVDIFVNGGRAVTGEVVGVLEDHIKQLPDYPAEFGWPDAELRTKWVQALETDPAFCPDHKTTEWRWLYTLGGLSKDQQDNLRVASEHYLKTPPPKLPEAPPLKGGGRPTNLPRKFNFAQVKQKFRSWVFWKMEPGAKSQAS